MAAVGSARSPRRLTPFAGTALIMMVLAAVSAVAVSLTPDRALLAVELPGRTLTVLLIACAVMFFVAERSMIHIEFRHQAYSFSLSGIPLVLGLLLAGPRELAVVRVAVALVVFTIQRPELLKGAYNTVGYVCEVALVGLIGHLAADPGGRATVRTAVVCYFAVALVDLLMTGLVLLVIKLHDGSVSRAEALGAFGPAAAFGAGSTTIAFTAVLLMRDGVVGFVVLGLLAAGTAGLYQGYLVLRRRHEVLALVHEFLETREPPDSGDGDGRELYAERLLTRLRDLMRAQRAELHVREGDRLISFQVGEGGDYNRTMYRAGEVEDWMLTRVYRNAEAIRVPREPGEPGLVRWLDERQATEALVVPLIGGDSQVEGVVLVLDRKGDISSFSADDLTLLQTLGAHLAVAMRGSQLLHQLRWDAGHDSLTGLANRALLTDRLRSALLVRESPTVLLLDLDRFKEVNDALGHHVGDALLQVVSRILTRLTPEDATVARLGGDEFAVLCPRLPDPQGTAVAIGLRIVEALSAPISLPEAVVTTGASIGVAVGGEEVDAADLLRRADAAMYVAKEGTEPVVAYTPELDRGRAEKLALLADLHLALERDELELRFQPQLDLRTNRVVSVEALVRWRHPRFGLLMPDAFVPLAESAGLIGQLTSKVLAQALRTCREWLDAGLDLTMAVNLSAQSVNNVSLPADVATALAAAGVPAERLILEITESSVMGDPERTVPTLKRLADVGVTLSLDDFGTGYSSLSYLQRLPVSEVKIDRSFIAGLESVESAHTSEALVRSILKLGESLRLRIVAEGVETAGPLEQLRELGCDLAQGYFIGRPLTSDELRSRLRVGQDGGLTIGQRRPASKSRTRLSRVG